MWRKFGDIDIKNNSRINENLSHDLVILSTGTGSYFRINEPCIALVVNNPIINICCLAFCSIVDLLHFQRIRIQDPDLTLFVD